jgi:multidrug efflux pump subunit AcrA (membrane-fusion protein)
MIKLATGMFVTWIALTGGAMQTSAPAGATHRLERCEVKPTEEILLPAEEAGVLVHLAVDEGSMSKRGDVIAQIDDRQATFQKDAAKAGHESAVKRATSDIEIRYAVAAAGVAQADYQSKLDANKRTPDSVSKIEVDKAKLQWDTTLLQIEKAKKDQSIAYLDAGVKQAEYGLANLGIERRAIKAPFDGVVVERVRRQNEWVNPGDPIMRYVRLDIMRVEQFIRASDFDPHEIVNCNVTVDVPLARGRSATFTGKITYVSPQLDYNNQYKVRAEVQNRQEAGQWLLRPNSLATMTIHLGTGNTVGLGHWQR